MSMSNAGKPTPPLPDHSPINPGNGDAKETAVPIEDPTTVPDVPVAGDVPDLGNADTIAELSQWCNIQRKAVRQLRVQLGDPNGGSVAKQQIWDVDEIVMQCLRHLRGHGCGDEQIQQLFAAWRKRKIGPARSILELLEKVEEDLSWAGGWANKMMQDKAAKTPEPLTPETEKLSPPVVSRLGTQILAALLKHYPKLRTIEEISEEVGFSERTIGPELKTLIEDRLAERPKGKGKGATLTPTGKALAERFPPV